MGLSGDEVRRRLAEAGLTVSAEGAEALRPSADGVLAAVARLRSARLGQTDPAPVLDAAFPFPAAEGGRDGA